MTIIDAVWQTAPITICYVQFSIMELFNCNKYAISQCQIWMICYGLTTSEASEYVQGLGLGCRDSVMDSLW